MDMDMKKIFAAAAAAILLLSSCDSWLEEKNYGSFTTEEMMANEENVILLVGQAYADVKWVHDHWGYWGVASLTSDECLCPIRTPGDHWADGNYWRNLNTHNWDPLSTAFRNIWNTTISGAVLCNKLLGTLEDGKANMNEAMYKQYVAELEVLRSYYYYLLFDCFGRVPYIEEFVTKTEPLMEPSKVWSKLVDCLERNAPNMPVVNDANRASNYGRVTQGFAYALLARLYLNAPSFDCTPSNISLTNEFTTAISSETDFYTNAVRCCDAIINAGSYSIEDNFFNNFKIKNEGSKENIFVIVEDGRSSVDVRENGSMMNKLRVNLLTLHYCHQNTYGMIEKPWNGFCARPTFLKRYAASDVRGPGNEGKGTANTKQWGWFVGPIYDAAGKSQQMDENHNPAIITAEVTDLGGATWNDGARLFKYEVDKDGAYRYCENDFVLLRYADVLWMREEAILRGASGNSLLESSADFQKLMARSFAYDADPAAAYKAAYPKLFTGTTEEKLQAILDERGREFAWENVRRRDLIRFGKYNDDSYVQYVTGKDEYRKWFPIPTLVLETSLKDENGNSIWTQNPGYPAGK